MKKLAFLGSWWSIVGTSCVPSVNQSRGGLIDLIWNVSQTLLFIVVYYDERELWVLGRTRGRGCRERSLR